jgi:TetR/AcrR family transcriptional regulator, regulator of cefoperazone and chloramphenicol sensitivity
MVKAPPAPATRPRRLRADDRRVQIVEAAFEMIADAGLESLRTRDVARRVGINPATLHYYFPTKEDLIAGVGEHLEAGYTQARGAPRRSTTPTPLGALRRELAEAAFFRRHRPRWLAVSREFATRAARDAAAAAVMERLTTGWRRSIETVLRHGVSMGAFRRNLDPLGTSTLIVCGLWAATTLLQVSDKEFRAMCREMERSVVRS